MSGQHFFHQHHDNQGTSIVSAPWARRIALMAAAVLFVVPGSAHAQSFWNWGAADYPEHRPAPQKRVKVKRKIDHAAEKAARNAPKPVGPLVIAVSIAQQRVKVYDSNGLFAEAPVSTGTKSHPTPMGVFSIIQKNKHHVSNLYGAEMPYMQRITWSGVALHTGPLPGYAASHGCIRLPNEFATRLWTWTRMGTRVIVAPGDISPADITHSKLIARMTPPQTISAAPGAATVAALAKPAPRRTADASDAMAAMKNTLSDADPATAAKETAPEIQKESEKIAAPVAVTEKPVSAEAPAVTEQRQPASEENAAVKDVASSEAKTTQTEAPATTGSETKAAESIAQPPAAVEPLAQDKEPTKVAAPDVKPAEAKSAETKAAETKSAETRPAEAPNPEIAAPAAAPEAAKPAVTAAAPKRGLDHVAVFISRKDQKLYVRQGYAPVFDVPVQIADIERPLGTHVFTARGDKDDQNALQWSVVSLPQVVRRSEKRSTKKGATAAASSIVPPLSASEALDRVSIPADALEKIAAIIAPGGSLLISDHGLNDWETGKGTDFIVPLR
ncbi:MAG: L,D-transpeptidase family protein [Xanthobacteraceae bacterium]